MKEITYCYDGSFDGFLCCIFESYVRKEIPTAIFCDGDPFPALFPSCFIETNAHHARRVFCKVKYLSPYAGNILQRAFLTCMPEKEIFLYRLVERLLREGPSFLRRQTDNTLYPLLTAIRHLQNEAHLLKGFLRFSDLNGVLGSEIQPKNQVLPLLQGHFCARYHQERFFIYDRTHHQALFHVPGKSVLQPLSFFEMAPPDSQEAHYRLLWKRFFDTVAIRERENPVCQRTHLPKRYRGTMTEFQEATEFKSPGSPAAVPAPGVPGGISAPERLLGSEPSVPGSSP